MLWGITNWLFWGLVQERVALFRLDTPAGFLVERTRCAFDLAHPLRVCSWLARNGPAGQCGVYKRFGFSMMDGRETVLPSAGRCCLCFFLWCQFTLE